MKIVLPLPPGGGPDAAARLMAELLKKRLGQTVTVENKAGASGQIGLKAVSQGPADGRSLAYVISAHVTIDLLSPSFDLLKELEPVTMVSSSPYLLLVKADAPYRTLAELVAEAKKNPGKLSYGTGGHGSAVHMGLAAFLDTTGLSMLHVPYKGALAANNGLAGGEVAFSAAIPSSAKALLASGRVRALAVTTAQRLSLLPEMPTVNEAIGLPFEFSSWNGYAVPKATPPAIVAALHKAITDAVRDPAFQEFMIANSSTSQVSASPQAFAEEIRSQYATEGALIKKLGIKLE